MIPEVGGCAGSGSRLVDAYELQGVSALITDDDPRIFKVLSDKQRLDELAAKDQRVREIYDGGRVSESVRATAVYTLLHVE